MRPVVQSAARKGVRSLFETKTILEPATAADPPTEVKLHTLSRRAVKLWDARTGNQLLEFEGWGEPSVAFSPDGFRLAVSSYRTVGLWYARMGDRLLELKGHTNRVTNVLYSP